MKYRGLYLVLCCVTALFFMGCQPKEFITLVAPTSTPIACKIDGNPVGNATQEGLKVKVEPGSHTASWTINGSPVSVPVELPVSERLLEFLLSERGISYNLNADFISAATLGSAPVLLYSGEEFNRDSDLQLSCAHITASVECFACVPYTFLAEVTVNIFSECLEEEGEGEAGEESEGEEEGDGVDFFDKNDNISPEEFYENSSKRFSFPYIVFKVVKCTKNILDY